MKGNKKVYLIAAAGAAAVLAGAAIGIYLFRKKYMAEAQPVDWDGDGDPDVWGADLDGDGVMDIYVKDEDGDGNADVVWKDNDGDGKPDEILIDTDGDGELDFGADVDGFFDGQDAPAEEKEEEPARSMPAAEAEVPAEEVKEEAEAPAEEAKEEEPEATATFADSDGDGNVDTVFLDLDGDGKVDVVHADTDGDGYIDAVLTDLDGDGKADIEEYDLDGDGETDVFVDYTGTLTEDPAPTVSLADTDGDGEPDAVLTDIDGDGKADIEEYDLDGDGTADVVVDYTGAMDDKQDDLSFGLDDDVLNGLIKDYFSDSK